MISFFKRPYKLDCNAKRDTRNAFLFGLFVFLFLYLFQPFKIGTYPGNLLLFTAGYGLVTTVVMLVLNVGIQQQLRAFFDENKWTTGREILWTLVNLGAIAAGNVIYTSWMGVMALSASSIFSLLAYTLAIGIFPITAGILVTESRNRNKYTAASIDINNSLNVKHSQKPAAPAKPGEIDVQIPSENVGEGFTVRPESLLYMKAAENYTEVYVINTGGVDRTIVRANLKMMEDALRDHPQFLRCHKSYVVNLGHCRTISGNAQGFKLHLNQTEDLIPVSRKLNNHIKDHLETFA